MGAIKLPPSCSNMVIYFLQQTSTLNLKFHVLWYLIHNSGHVIQSITYNWIEMHIANCIIYQNGIYDIATMIYHFHSVSPFSVKKIFSMIFRRVSHHISNVTLEVKRIEICDMLNDVGIRWYRVMCYTKVSVCLKCFRLMQSVPCFEILHQFTERLPHGYCNRCIILIATDIRYPYPCLTFAIYLT